MSILAFTVYFRTPAINCLYGDKIDLAIDHHRSNKGYAPITYVNADAGANCENIYELILELGVEIDKKGKQKVASPLVFHTL